MNKKLVLTLVTSLFLVQPVQGSFWSSLSRNKSMLSILAAGIVCGVTYCWYKFKRSPKVIDGRLTVLCTALNALERNIRSYLQRIDIHNVLDNHPLSYVQQYQMLHPIDNNITGCLREIDSLKVYVNDFIADKNLTQLDFDTRNNTFLDDVSRLQQKFINLTT